MKAIIHHLGGISDLDPNYDPDSPAHNNRISLFLASNSKLYITFSHTSCILFSLPFFFYIEHLILIWYMLKKKKKKPLPPAPFPSPSLTKDTIWEWLATRAGSEQSIC